MTDIKIGDWVFINNSMRIWEVTDIEGESAYITSEGFGSIWMVLEKLCPATPTEIAAGHRIDTPLNSTISPTRHDLHQDGAMVQDGGKEAVIANERGFDVWLHALYEESPGINENKFILGAQLAWQHQQAVVTTLTEALDIKEQLNQKLREREEELQKRVGALSMRLIEARASAHVLRDEIDITDAGHWLIKAFEKLEQALGADHESN